MLNFPRNGLQKSLYKLKVSHKNACCSLELLEHPKKDAVDLKCKNRRLQQSVEDAEVFLSDLDYCSSDWKEAQAKLKQSLDHFNIEMISAFIYVFLLGKSFI